MIPYIADKSRINGHLVHYNVSCFEEKVKASPAIVAFEQELENILLKFAKKSNEAEGCYAISDNVGKRFVNVYIYIQ